MTHRSTQRDTTGNGRGRSPAVIALVRAVKQEIEHLALAASRGTLDALEPLAIPHGPLLANLHALHLDLWLWRLGLDPLWRLVFVPFVGCYVGLIPTRVSA